MMTLLKLEIKVVIIKEEYNYLFSKGESDRPWERPASSMEHRKNPVRPDQSEQYFPPE